MTLNKTKLGSDLNHLAQRFPHCHFDCLIWVDITQQRLYLIQQNQVIQSWLISSADKGTGQAMGSYQTPLGLHQIAAKFGDQQPLGMTFKARQATGQLVPILTQPEQRSDQDNITTRILWLEGLEEGYNQGDQIDSKARYIYIHGTDEEGRLGTPASHGCIRMANQAVIELYEQVETGTYVYITLGI